MSFLAGIKSFFSSPAGAVVQIATLVFLAKKMASNTIPQNNTGDQPANIDAGVRLPVKASASNKIPVVYGTAYKGGIITDAQMTNNNKTMWYCLTISEKTGTKLSDGQASDYVFKDIYWNDQRIVFKNDGITVDYTVDREGNVDRSLENQVKFYCYKGNSDTPTIPENYTNTATTAAYNLMPDWTAAHDMNELIFALVRVDYNRERNVTGLSDNVLFQISNSMYLPGDVLYDYMKSTRYGAGISTTEILSA